MIELKPCPFCGGKALHKHKDSEKYKCSNINCDLSTDWFENWNTRPGEERVERALEVAIRTIKNVTPFLNEYRIALSDIGAMLKGE